MSTIDHVFVTCLQIVALAFVSNVFREISAGMSKAMGEDKDAPFSARILGLVVAWGLLCVALIGFAGSIYLFVGLLTS